MLQVQAFFDDATHTVSYLIHDLQTKAAAIVDPVWDFDADAARLATKSADEILDAAREGGLDIKWVLETHAHADHLTAAHYIREVTGAKVGIGAHIKAVQTVFSPFFHAEDVCAEGSAFDRLFEDGETFDLGAIQVRVIHTPGHTPACVTYVAGDAAFVGDTLFMPDFGTARTDFPGGDAATLYRSIRRILDLPPETRIFVGHDYLPEGREHFAWETSVAEQREKNIHVHDGISEAEFVKMRTTRDAKLDAPHLILPSLQVNIRAGELPPAEADGHVYLKLPVNRL